MAHNMNNIKRYLDLQIHPQIYQWAGIQYGSDEAMKDL
jgi:hypothetical protein